MPGDFCGLLDHECYPVSGSCGADHPCPDFGMSGPAIDCGNDGYCHVPVSPPSTIHSPVLEHATSIVVTAPTIGQVFSSEMDLHFTWEDVGVPTIALVLDVRPENAEDLDGARWFETVPVGHSADWGRGHAIIKGGWQASPGAAPLRTLYFVVEAFNDGKVVAVSPAVPFAVSNVWKQPFDACMSEGKIPGDCTNPALPQGCHLHRCRVLCASQRDCDAHTETQGQACALPEALDGDPRPLVRFCE